MFYNSEYKKLSIKKIKQYIYENINVYLLASILFFIIYGRQIYVINTRIDTEMLINNTSSTYNWLEIGRQGGIFTRILFERLNFNPYFATSFSLILLIISMIVFSYLLDYTGGIKARISILIFMIFIVHPIWAEQFYFTLQVLEISVALLCVIIAVLLSFRVIFENDKNILLKILTVMLMIWAFSTYQLFIVLYVALSIFSFMMFYRRLYVEKIDADICIKLIVNIIVLFVISVLINELTTKIFFSSGIQYLDGQIRWGKDSLKICLFNIIKHVASVVSGRGIFYSISFAISALGMMICLINEITKMKNIKYRFIYMLAGIGLQTAPFIITLYGAIAPAFRAQFVLPFVTACNLGFILISIEQHKYMKVISYLTCLIIFLSQTQIVMRLQYTDDIRFQEDMRLSDNIYTKVSAISNGINKPVAFVGTKEAQLNNACINGELIGKSIFSFDAEVSPHYLYSSSRICGLSKTMGINFNSVSAEQMYEARRQAYSMPIWPQQGSVVDYGDFIIVKLSDDKWAFDDGVIDTSIEKINISNLAFDSDNVIRWNIDEKTIIDNHLSIRGWRINFGEHYDNPKTMVCIYNEDSNELYKLKTLTDIREDLNDNFASEKDYSSSGYIARATLNDIDSANLSNFRIVLNYTDSIGEKYIDTGIYIR